MRIKIKELLLNQFSSVYCDTCSAEGCDECCRKSMYWAISEDYAECLANKIANIIKEEE